MKISLNWLQDFVTQATIDPEAIARRVTTGCAEVDDVEVQGALLGKCCVGKVLTVSKHPNADRLSLCDVQTDKGVKKVVCGGSNLRVGMRVAFAHVGARVLWHGTEMMTLEKIKVRNVESEGMICSAAELDLTARFPQKDEREIIDLPSLRSRPSPSGYGGQAGQAGDGDEGVGRPLKEFLGLDDVVLHIDNHAITNRADLFSHTGFAREFVALGLAQWKGDRGGRGHKGRKGDLKSITFPKLSLPMKCIVDRKDLVPRYSSCLLTIESLGETPAWMRRRLESTGWRCVSLPVDITNYVAMETGMPLHSFDADDIRGDFHMRGAKEGERITTLDGVERVLPEGAIVLSDSEGIFDLLGIMGGLRSSTKESTRRIYLHAAVADPVAIRKAIIATGHRTDASTVYEKGIPREAASRGLLRAVELFLQLVPGCRIASKLEEWGDEGKAKAISLPLERVHSLLGVEVPEKKIEKILSDLEFTVAKTRKKTPVTPARPAGGRNPQPLPVRQAGVTLTVTPPLHRLGDIRGPHDLIEEIGRIVGYNEIPVQMPRATIDPPRCDARMHRLRDGLQERGYSEIVPISLIGEALLRKAGLDPAEAVQISNPIGEELGLLHTSTLPGLLEHAQRNILHAGRVLKTFHLARVFKEGQAEHLELGMLVANMEKSPEHRTLLEDPFLHCKTDLQETLRSIGYELDIAVAGELPSSAHPGRYAELLVRAAAKSALADEAGPFTPVGRIFAVHPSIASSFDLPHRAAAMILDCSAVLAIVPSVTIARPVPQFPSIVYDVTLTGQRMTEQIGDLLKRLRGSHAFLENVAVKDLYAADGSYNLTLTFTYRAADRTLTEDEVKPVHEKILQGVGKE